MHEDMEVEMDAALRDLLARGKEFEDLKTSSILNSRPSPRVVWSLPTSSYIKFNTDAVVGLTSSSIAVVARNWRGTVVLACSKKVNTTIPLQAEAKALVWASHLFVELGVDKVVFKSDSKVCIDVLNNLNALAYWRIRNRLHTFLLNSNDHSC